MADENVEKTPKAEDGVVDKKPKSLSETVESYIDPDDAVVAADDEVAVRDTSSTSNAEDGEGDLEDEAEGDEGSEEGADPEAEGDEGEGEEGAEASEADTVEPFLKSYDAKDQAEWDKRFKKEGKLDIAAIQDTWMKTAKVGADGEMSGELPEGLYGYLEAAGIPKDMVKQYEANQMAEAKRITKQLYEDAGGQDVVQAAIKWGKEGGYSEAAQARFNAAMKSQDQETISEALSLVVSKYQKANPTPPPKEKNKLSPAKSPTTSKAGGDASGVQGYKSRDEWQKAYREIDRIGDHAKRQKAHALHRQRTRATPKAILD